MIKKIMVMVLLCSVVLHAADTGEVVVTIEPDDFLTHQVEPGVQSFVGLVAGLGPWKAAQLARNAGTFKKEYEAIEPQTPGGVGNALHALSPRLRKRVDISSYLDDLLERSVNPELLEGSADRVRRIKESGHKVVAATKQDFAHWQVYRRKLSELGIEWDDCFDATVVAEYSGHGDDDKAAQSDDGLVEQETGIFTVHAPHVPTDAEYWRVVAAVAQRQVGAHKKWQGVHVDADEKVVRTADAQGNFHAVHHTGDFAALQAALGEHGIEMGT